MNQSALKSKAFQMDSELEKAELEGIKWKTDSELFQLARTAALRAGLTSHNHRDVYQCPLKCCARNFDRKYNLKVHMRKHTKVTPYVCDRPGCSKEFAWRSSLGHHRKHHARLDRKARAEALKLLRKSQKRTSAIAKRPKSSRKSPVVSYPAKVQPSIRKDSKKKDPPGEKMKSPEYTPNQSHIREKDIAEVNDESRKQPVFSPQGIQHCEPPVERNQKAPSAQSQVIDSRNPPFDTIPFLCTSKTTLDGWPDTECDLEKSFALPGASEEFQLPKFSSFNEAGLYSSVLSSLEDLSPSEGFWHTDILELPSNALVKCWPGA